MQAGCGRLLPFYLFCDVRVPLILTLLASVFTLFSLFELKLYSGNGTNFSQVGYLFVFASRIILLRPGIIFPSKRKLWLTIDGPSGGFAIRVRKQGRNSVQRNDINRSRPMSVVFLSFIRPTLW